MTATARGIDSTTARATPNLASKDIELHKLKDYLSVNTLNTCRQEDALHSNPLLTSMAEREPAFQGRFDTRLAAAF